MTDLVMALRKKFKTPQEAIKVLGLDENILFNSKNSKTHTVEDNMRKKYSVSQIAKLAEDAKVTSLSDVLDLLAKDEAEETEEEKKKRLAESAERFKESAEKKAEDEEETDEEKEARLKKEKKAEDEEETEAEAKREKKEGEEKKAMDAAIAKAKAEAISETRTQMKALAEAERLVKPWVGEMVAQDSAEDVYKTALELKGHSVKGVHPSAYRSMCEMAMEVEQTPKTTAMDSKAATGFAERFPELNNVRSM